MNPRPPHPPSNNDRINLGKRSLAYITAKLLRVSACIYEVISVSHETGIYISNPAFTNKPVRVGINGLTVSNELHLVATAIHILGEDHNTIDKIAGSVPERDRLSATYLTTATATYLLAKSFDELLTLVTSNAAPSASLFALETLNQRCLRLGEITAFALEQTRNTFNRREPGTTPSCTPHPTTKTKDGETTGN